MVQSTEGTGSCWIQTRRNPVTSFLIIKMSSPDVFSAEEIYKTSQPFFCHRRSVKHRGWGSLGQVRSEVGSRTAGKTNGCSGRCATSSKTRVVNVLSNCWTVLIRLHKMDPTEVTEPPNNQDGDPDRTSDGAADEENEDSSLNRTGR